MEKLAVNRGTVVTGVDYTEVMVRTFMSAIDACDPARTLCVALSGGSTPRPLFERLRTETLPWSRLAWYWVDERFVPYEDARSNAGEAKRLLFDHIPTAQIFPFAAPPAASIEHAAEAYEALLAEGLPATGFDIVLLGIGDDGHTASLFPNEPEVHVRDRRVVHVPARPTRDARLSLTAPVLQSAQHVLVLARGQSKIAPLRRARGIDSTSLDHTPASLLLDATGTLTYVVDAALEFALRAAAPTVRG
jgi:6-phosphogluconolactonase